LISDRANDYLEDQAGPCVRLFFAFDLPRSPAPAWLTDHADKDRLTGTGKARDMGSMAAVPEHPQSPQ
jgi:hypothetical protein